MELLVLSFLSESLLHSMQLSGIMLVCCPANDSALCCMGLQTLSESQGLAGSSQSMEKLLSKTTARPASLFVRIVILAFIRQRICSASIECTRVLPFEYSIFRYDKATEASLSYTMCRQRGCCRWGWSCRICSSWCWTVWRCLPWLECQFWHRHQYRRRLCHWGRRRLCHWGRRRLCHWDWALDWHRYGGSHRLWRYRPGALQILRTSS